MVTENKMLKLVVFCKEKKKISMLENNEYLF